MKALKRIFYGVAIGLIIVCSLVLVCALNPSLTRKLASGLYKAEGQESGKGEKQAAETAPVETAAPENTEGPGGTTALEETGASKETAVPEDEQENTDANADANALSSQSLPGSITWQSTWNGTAAKEEASEAERLAEAGVTEEEVLSTMEDYYADCLKQMTEAGSGEIQFSNVVPESLWSSVERVYSDGSYKNGYVTKALEELEMEEFAIQLQGERLGGGYYRLHHTISTWN